MDTLWIQINLRSFINQMDASSWFMTPFWFKCRFFCNVVWLWRRYKYTVDISVLYIIEPISLIGEGEYNLNVLKEIKATDSYLELDQDVRKCQNDEPLFNCTTRKFIETILSECKCLPSNLGLTNKVRQFNNKHFEHILVCCGSF